MRRWLVLLILLLLPWETFGAGVRFNADLTVEGALNYCADVGSTDAYACNLNPALEGVAYGTGQCYIFKANTANTGAASINFNGVGAATIKKVMGGVTTDLVTNDIRAGQVVNVCFDGTNMQMQSTLGNASGTAIGLTVTELSAATGTVAAPTCTGGGPYLYYRHNITGTLTIPAVTGTCSDGQEMTFVLKSATPQDVTFTLGAAGFSADAGVPLPNTTTGGTTYDYYRYRYNSTAVRWLLIGTTQSTAPLAAVAGGTGSALLAAHGVVIGQGTDSVTTAVPTAANQCLTSHPTNPTTADPSFQPCAGVITEADFSFTDITTANASTGTHGLLPKLSGNSAQVLKGDGTWGTDAVGSASPGGSDGHAQYRIDSTTFGGSPGFLLDIDGIIGERRKCVSVSSNTTFTARCYFVDTTSGNITLTLLNAAMTNGAADIYDVYKVSNDANQLIIAADTGDNLNFVAQTLTTTSRGAGFHIEEQDGASTGNWIVTRAVTSVTASMLTVSATDRLLGRDAAGAGVAEEITPTDVKTMLALNNVDNTSDTTKWAATKTLTNTTLSAGDPGNLLTTTSKAIVYLATCQNTTALLNLDTPTTNAATATCKTGSNTQKGVAVFADAVTAYLQDSFPLPDDFTGAMDVKLFWFNNGTSAGNVEWEVATVCSAVGESDNLSFNAASTVIDAALTNATNLNVALITGVTTTGCVAGEMFHYYINRNAVVGNTEDTLADAAQLYRLEWTLRRAQ